HLRAQLSPALSPHPGNGRCRPPATHAPFDFSIRPHSQVHFARARPPLLLLLHHSNPVSKRRALAGCLRFRCRRLGHHRRGNHFHPSGPVFLGTPFAIRRFPLHSLHPQLLLHRRSSLCVRNPC